MKGRPVRIDTADPVPYTGRNGNGHDPRRWVPTIDVGGDIGPAAGRRTPVLRAFEPDPRRGRLRCLRREALRSVLRADGATESGAGPLLSAALGRLLRGPGFGAGDRLAGRRFAESAVVSASGAAGVAARPFDDLADAATAESGNARGGLHLGAAAACRRGSGAGQDGGGRRDDAGGERDVAQHRSPRHGRGLHGIPDAAGRGVWNLDTDSCRAGALRQVPQEQEEDIERRLDPPA